MIEKKEITVDVLMEKTPVEVYEDIRKIKERLDRVENVYRIVQIIVILALAALGAAIIIG